MSEETKSTCNSAACSSDCSSCGCDCGASSSGVGNHSTITLTLDNGSEVECAILTDFAVDENAYIALLPLDESGQNRDGQVWLFKFTTNEEAIPMLANIEDDDEYARAADAFDAIFQKARQQEMDGEPLEIDPIQ